jgi:hypothetical protein
MPAAALSCRGLSTASSHQLAPAFAEMWIAGTSPAMTTESLPAQFALLAATSAFTLIALIPGGPDCAYDAPAAALTGRLDPTPDVAAAGVLEGCPLGA